MADKIMRAEAQISAKDAGFSATLSKMGAALKGLGRAAKSVEGLPANIGGSAKGLAAAGRAARGASTEQIAAALAVAKAQRRAALISGGMAAAGVAGAVGYGASKVIGAGQKAQHEKLRMEASGMAQNEIEDANTQALALARKIPNFDQTTILHMLRNARTIVGSYEEAANLMEPILKMRALAQAARPGEDMTEDFDKLLKAFEIKGVTQDPAKFKSYMEGMAKTINTFGDTVKPVDYYEMFKLGRQSTQSLSQDYMQSVAPTLVQDIGGPGAGVAQQAFFRAIVAGKMDKGALAAMQDYGLIDPSKVVKKKGGDLASVKPGGIVGSELAQVNPYEWVNQILLPALAKKGVVDPDKIQQVISTLFSKSTAAQLVGIFATQQARIDKDAAMRAGAKGLEAFDDFNSRDGGVAMGNLKTQAESAMQEVGQSLANALAGPANDAAKALAGWTARLHENSEADKRGEVSPGQQRANKILDDIFPTLKILSTAEVNAARYRIEMDALFAKIEALTPRRDEAQAQLDRHPDSQVKKDSLARVNGEIAALAAQANALIGAREATAAAAKALDEAATRAKEFAGYAFNQPRPEVPASIPAGAAKFPLSKGYGGLAANGAPLAPGASGSAAPAPLDLKAILNGKIEAKADVTGHAFVQADFKVEAGSELLRVVDGGRRVIKDMPLSAGKAGFQKPSTGATMPGAGSAATPGASP